MERKKKIGSFKIGPRDMSLESTGGALFLYGVPGTGKTATTTKVMS